MSMSTSTASRLRPLLALPFLTSCASPAPVAFHAPPAPDLGAPRFEQVDAPSLATPTPTTSAVPVAAPSLFPVFRSNLPTPVPTPTPSTRLASYNASHVLVPFVSNRLTGGVGGYDIFIYDRTVQTVLTLPGANTPADEFNPSLSNNNRWLVYSTNVRGNSDIWVYDMQTQLVDSLPTLNTPANEVSPSIDGVGDMIVYTGHEDGIDRLHLYSLRTGTNYVPALVARLGTTINNPFISSDASLVAFSTPVPGRQLDIFVYDIKHASLFTPPFVNTDFTEDEPVLSPDNHRLVFSTNRNGNEDVMLVNLQTGFLDRLPLANSPADEVTPSFIGPKANEVLYLSDRAGKANRQLLVYDLATDLLDTLPVSHVLGRIDTFSPP